MKKSFHLVFPANLIKEPIMFLVARDNHLTLNIRRAKITALAGEATIELEGKEDDLARAERALKEKDVQVQGILGDTVE